MGVGATWSDPLASEQILSLPSFGCDSKAFLPAGPFHSLPDTEPAVIAGKVLWALPLKNSILSYRVKRR